MRLIISVTAAHLESAQLLRLHCSHFPFICSQSFEGLDLQGFTTFFSEMENDTSPGAEAMDEVDAVRCRSHVIAWVDTTLYIDPTLRFQRFRLHYVSNVL